MSTNTITYRTGICCGGGLFTVGNGGRFRTLQEAINEALTGSAFTEASITGTASVTQNSKTVTLTTATTADFNYYSHVSFASGSNRKWYPIKLLAADAATVILDVPYQEANNATASIVVGNPNLQSIVLLENVTENVYINTTGNSSGTQLDAFCISFSCTPGVSYDGVLRYNAKSGVLLLDNFSSVAGYSNVIRQVAGTDTKSVIDLIVKNVHRNNAPSQDIDWLFPESTANTKTGRLFLENCTAIGAYDIVLPAVLGRVEASRCRFKSDPIDENLLPVRNQSIARIFGTNGIIAHFMDSSFECSLDGGASYSASAYLGDAANGITTTGHTIIFDRCGFVGEHTSGGTEVSIYSVIRWGCTDSDIYLNNCSAVLSGSPTIQAGWKNFKDETSLSGTDNRVRLHNTKLLDLPSDTGNLTVSSITGQGSPKALTFAASLTAAELDILRGDSFTVTMTGNITTVPTVLNAPDGAEITLIFTQDGTGGYTVGGFNAAYIFHTAWTNTGNTANKVSLVKFKKSGSNWYQISAANSWL